MAHRRRDTSKRSSAYSSADFYRSLQNPTSPSALVNPPSAPSSVGHVRSDSEDDIVATLVSSATVAGAGMSAAAESRPMAQTSTAVNEDTALTRRQPSPPPAVARRGRETERTSPERAGSNGYTNIADSSGRDNSPLSPPRPSFLAGSTRAGGQSSSDRGSWSSASIDPVSDSDVTSETSEPFVAATGGVAARRSIGRERSSTGPNTGFNARLAAQARHHRRRSTLDDSSQVAGPNSFDSPPSSIYVPPPGVGSPASSVFAAATANVGNRPPPSAFLPFQSHPGNPDPGMPIPGVSRRVSVDSLGRNHSRPLSANGMYTDAAGYTTLRSGLEVVFGASTSQVSLERPYAPFMDATSGDGSATPPSPSASQNNVYKNSAAGALSGSNAALTGNGELGGIPRTSSAPQIAMRAPFLSPASRPTSIWSPPSYPYPPSLNSPSLPNLRAGASSTPPLSYYFKPTKTKALMPSTRLSDKLTEEDKPWLSVKPPARVRLSWWLTLLCFILGVGGGAVVCFFGWTGVKMLKDGDLCLKLNEEFNAGSLDSNTWNTDIEMGGFGNGEFQITTDDAKNLHVTNGQLYITPTLTSDEIGADKVLDGGSYSVPQCSQAKTNSTACSAKSSKANQQAIPPVMSARINTQGKYSIKFGKVEVKAKLPSGDWLWPAIWMLPEDDSVYGPWPVGGEMDIMEARGNGLSYPAQGVDFVRSSLNYGVYKTLQTHIFGWWSSKRSPYDQGFHTYSMEWTPDWMRFYVDSRLQATINMKMSGKGGKSFFDRGDYPTTTDNGNGTDVVVQNVWAQGSNAAPFDQAFYLILDLAAGGTSGWFPDGVGNKPWFDNSNTALYDFAKNQDTWYATWPQDENDRAFRVDSVKMWQLGRC